MLRWCCTVFSSHRWHRIYPGCSWRGRQDQRTWCCTAFQFHVNTPEARGNTWQDPAVYVEASYIFSPWCRHHTPGSTDTRRTQWLPWKVWASAWAVTDLLWPKYNTNTQLDSTAWWLAIVLTTHSSVNFLWQNKLASNFRASKANLASLVSLTLMYLSRTWY